MTPLHVLLLTLALPAPHRPAQALLPAIRDHMLPEARRHLPLAQRHGLAHGVDPYLILAYVRHESGLNPDVYNIGCRRRHPRRYHLLCTAGLAQLPPRYYARKAGGARRLLDPSTNLRLFAEVFRWLLDRYGSERRALIAANWGVGRVERGVPAPASTLRYVGSILALRDVYRRLLGGSV